MVFSSIPIYLDPVNWQQQQQQKQQLQLQQQIGTTACNNSYSASTHHRLLPAVVLLPSSNHRPHPPPPGPQPPAQIPHVGGSSDGAGGGGPTASSSIRPGSMAERARVANISMPEASLKCPRCDSTNTKFCYFNNYSHSQPRHFCKTCRRYWTRGGCLRNVPVGGGCRRNNKRSSKGAGGTSKSTPSCSSDRSTTTATATTTSASATSSVAPSLNSTGSLMADILGLTTQVSPLGLMPPITSLNQYHYDGHGGEYHMAGCSLNYPPMSATVVSDMSFQLGSSSFSLGGGEACAGGGGGGSFLSAPPPPPVPLYFPLLGGIDSSTTLYPFDTSIDHMSSFCHQVRPKLMHPGIGIHPAGGDHDQVMKMEENQELNLMSRQFLGLHGNDHRYWCGVGDGSPGGGSGGSWPDMSGVNASCSTSHVL